MLDRIPTASNVLGQVAEDPTGEGSIGVATSDRDGVYSGGELSIPDGPMARWFLELVDTHGDRPAALTRSGSTFETHTFDEVHEEARLVAGALLEEGLEPGDRVAVRSSTRYEWTVVDIATHLSGLVLVPIYPTFGSSQAVHVLEDAQADVLIAEGEVDDEIQAAVETIFSIDDLPHQPVDSLAGEDRKDDDVATIIYTSGTTGLPKGCALSHRNLLAAMSMVSQRLPIKTGSVGTCFLPLSHALQRLAVYVLWNDGSSAAYMHVDDLKDELTELHPNVFYTVPRVFRRMYDTIQEQASSMSGPKGWLVSWGNEVALEYGRALSEGHDSPSTTLELKHQLADRLVYSKLREQLGFTDIQYAVTGAASIDPDILYYFWGLGVPVLEGWGATEITAPGTMNRPDAFKPGTVGQPLAGVDVKLADDGELLARGPNVMQGYWRNEEATDEAIQDGWYHTGDLAEIDDDGFVTIVDRKKQIAVLDTGENVVPSRVENALTKQRYIEEAMIVAEGRKFVSALVQPNFESLVEYAREHDLAVGDTTTDAEGQIVSVDRELLQTPEVRSLFESAIASANEDLIEYEQVGQFELLERALSVEHEELTPTLKKRRSTIEDHFSDRIEAMYE